MEVSLKCQFCPLDFNSAYKMIPHVYFGHRKKISRQVRDQRKIFLKCPAPGCDFSHSNPVEDARPEIIFSTLADMFLVVEDHIVTAHTKEQKLVECPYCSLQLTNCVYWVHLEQHMNSTSSPATPVSRPPSATSRTPESPRVAPPASETPLAVAQNCEQTEKEEVQRLSSQSIASKSSDSPDLAETVAKESNVEDISNPDVSKGTRSGKNTKPQRSQILKDIEEINKKIALKLKEEQESKMNLMEVDQKDSQLETPKIESSEELVTCDNKESIREEESITSLDIQMTVEKRIEESIVQNDQIKDKSIPAAQAKVEERSLNEAQVTATEAVVKEERKKEENEEKLEILKPRSREISGENDAGNRRRSISGEKRRTRTSVWNKEQQNSAAIKIQGITSVEVKSKPVLTEEMERSIIYGNFKMKDPGSRDDKRVAVKREIENLFKEEEEKKKRINEEKRKAEEKEREKLRMAEERLRKEREKLKEEKKRNKQRRKEIKEEAEAELEEESYTENVEFEPEDSNQDLSSASSPMRPRSKSPDQYQKIQFEISKMFKENEVGTRADKRPLERDSQSPEPVMNKIARTAPPTVVSYKVEEEEEDDDDLEMMMREFQERQTTSTDQPKSREKSVTTASLSLIQNSYNSEMKEDPTPPTVLDIETESSPPLSPLISSSLSCHLCREEDGNSAVYKSAYQLLAHVFLAHRKKIVSGSRKSGEMSLTCPQNCGFVSPTSSEGKSIDYFNNSLAEQLSWLSEHMVGQHTGEDRLLHCPDCGLGLELGQVWAWQHLANHTDTRRRHCGLCNNFPFRNEAHRCTVQQEGETEVSSTQREVELTRAEECEGGEEEKYLLMAHKFGEVFCSVCLAVVLGHHWPQHKLSCEEPPVSRVNIVKYRGDTWLEVGETKVKVFYDYDDQDTQQTTQQTILAKCSFNQINFTGSGTNHEKAEDVLRQDVLTFVNKSQDRVNGTNGYEEEEEDHEEKAALLEMFIEMAAIDEAASTTFSSLEVGEDNYSVDTEFYFTKCGRVKLLSSVVIEEQQFQDYGDTRAETLGNLVAQVRHHMQQ